MAFSSRRGGGVGPAGSRLPRITALGEDGALAELNITPMIDVMLALLIIFIVVTPVMGDYAAEPPAAVHVTPKTLEDAITLGIDARGTWWLADDSVPRAELAARLKALYASRQGDHLLYIRADRSLPWRVVLDAVDAGRAAGVHTIGAISTPRPDSAGSPVP